MRKYILFLAVFFCLPLVSLGATEPFLYLTWNARSYVPDSYLGKIIPGSNSPIIVSLEAIQDGKVADLRSSTIKWYVDGELFSSAIGQKSFTIRTPKKLTSGIMSIRAEVIDKWDRIKMKTVDIPMSPPVVVLKSNYLSRSFGENKISVSAFPYFFGATSLSDLVFSWKVNGQAVNSAENPQVVDISFNQDAEPGSSITVEGSVSNPNGVREAATKREIFKYIP
jgi:hypothetical protein